jgi:hypothetical protein
MGKAYLLFVLGPEKYEYVNLKRKAKELRNHNWDELINELKKNFRKLVIHRKIRFVFWFDN